MNDKNLTYLKDNIKYMGFGEKLYPELETQLKKGAPEFSIPFKTEINKKEMDATLHFRKSDSSDMYFFNKYDVRVGSERKDETLAQTFYLNKGQGVTLKEAYNLLNGRSVHKELVDKNDQKYQAWVQLDFGNKDKNGNYERKQYHQNYGYDLKEALKTYPIKELNNEEAKDKLVRSLQKGNVQSVTMEIGGKESKFFIEANPQYKSLNLYNGNMQSLNQEERQKLIVKPDNNTQDMGNKNNKEKAESLVREDQPGKKQEKGIKKGVDEDSGTMPEKKNKRKKGLSV